ncbi:DHA1 family tetracycline resistance protein-like MFS transporter [Thioclava sp. ES.031]|uniref:TCR/Tet family MFS transporter n=1 Tax=Thioclava sp. ES.031 TaxID=1798203 RepID=UPI000BF8F2E6|nr:TCR/Tet family MFS transporter [Thioclava sp. ES.031]PFG62771.1 DHA1 family tetracycline resistance protein-like MFS transporter [Thioclava sp. ES.031]
MTAAPIGPSRFHATAFVLIAVFLDMVGFGLIIPVLPSLIADVGHVDLAQASRIGGWMFAAFSLAQFLFAPLMGNLSDRFGRRPLLLLAIGGLGVDYLFHAFAPTLLWLFVGRIVAGICGASYVIANAYLADITPPAERARAFGLIGAAFGFGFIAGPALGGFLGELGPRIPFFVAAALSGLNLIYGLIVLPESLPQGLRRPVNWRACNPLGTLKVFARYPGVLPMGTALGVYLFASAVYPAIWPYWGMAKFGWSEGTVGLTLAGYGVVAAIFQGGLAGPLASRLGEARVVVIGLIVGIGMTIALGLSTSLVMVLIVLLITGIEGLVHPMIASLMSNAVPEDAQGALQGGISALMNLAMLAGTLFFTQVFGIFLAENAPIRTPDMAFYVASVILLAALVLFIRARKVE